MLCKYKLRIVTVLFYDEEIANKKNSLSQHDEMCRVVVNRIFFQMTQLLYVTFRFANISFMIYGVSFSVGPDFMIQS